MLLFANLNRKLTKLICIKLFYIAIAAVAMTSLAGCQPPEINIIDVAQKKSGKTVYLTGKVINLAPFIDNAAYKLQDDSGAVWVVTSQNPPKINAIVSIKGKIQYQSLPFAETELGDFYVIELQQLEASLN